MPKSWRKKLGQQKQEEEVMDSNCKQEIYRDAAKSFAKPEERLSKNRSMHIAKYVSRANQRKVCQPVSKKKKLG